MFLPVLLVRDYGIRAFLIFAVPNMIGAASMGAVLRDPQTSVRLVRAHGVACVAFSTITLLFHAFFVAWVVRGLIGTPALWITAILAIAMIGGAAKDVAARRLAACAFAISLGAFAIAFSMSRNLAAAPIIVASRPATDLIGLTAVCTFGFALCPYLDLTFHRARQSTGPRDGSAAFAIGFLVFFPLMILFTLWYAPRLAPSRWALIPTAIAWVIAVHLMVQSALTVAFHARAIGSHRRSIGGHPSLVTGGIAIIVLIGGLMGLPFAGRGREAGETAYRLFMFFYALPFPAYVWICMTPLREDPPALHPRRLITFVVAVAMTAPLFWFAFFGGKMLLLAPAVATVFVARFVARRARADARGY